MFERPPSTIGKEFKLLNLIFLSLCLKLWFIDLLVVKSISQIPWANFRQSRMPVHVSWPVLNRETLLNKSVTIYVGILSIAISSRIAVAPYQVSSSYYWPITSFTKNLIIFALIMCVYRFTRGLRLAQSVRCPDHVSKHLEIGRLLVPYQICGISCRYLFV